MELDTPQPQPREHQHRHGATETGPVLTEAILDWRRSDQLIDWGKAAYAAGENGGISGIVFYAYTRAENDPRYAGGEPWEPGIPRVQVNLYARRRHLTA